MGWPRRFRRTGIVLLGLVALLLVLLVVAQRVLAGERARRMLADELELRLAGALARGVQVADVRVTFLPPRLTVKGLVVGDPAQPQLTVALTEVHLGGIAVADFLLVFILSLINLRLFRPATEEVTE